MNSGHCAGATFNPGERVEGYSTPTLMLLSAAALAVGLDPGPQSSVLERDGQHLAEDEVRPDPADLPARRAPADAHHPGVAADVGAQHAR